MASLRRVLGSVLGQCTCQCARVAVQPQRPQRRFASTAQTDRLQLAARKLLDTAARNNDGSIEAAKKERELEGLRRALRDVEQGDEVSQALTCPLS